MNRINQIRIAGEYYEMGVSIGKMLKDLKLKDFPPKFKEDQIAFGKECEKAVKQHAPGLLEELHGIADASGLDFEALSTHELSFGLKPCCTVFAISGNYTNDGFPRLARNYDWLLSFQQHFTCYRTSPANGLSSLSFCDSYLGRTGGVNEAGLAIALTLSPVKAIAAGMNQCITIRWILDSCSTIEEAVAYFQKIPKVQGNSYLIVDKESNIVKIETCPEKTVVSKVDSGFAVITNHFQSLEMKEFEDPKQAIGTSIPRYTYISNWFSKRENKIDDEYIKTALREHYHEVCVHDPTGEWATLWSWITRVGERAVFLSNGHPCKNKFERLTF